MAKNIFVTGSGAVGKTLLIYGLMNILMEEGYTVRYFKPVSRGMDRLGPGKWVDDDVLAMKEVVMESFELQDISPIVIRERFLEYGVGGDGLTELILKAHEKIGEDADAIFIESYGEMNSLSSIGLSGFDICRLTGAKLLYIIKNGYDVDVDEAVYWLSEASKRGVEKLGVIINGVPVHLWDRVDTLIRDFLSKLDINLYGLIPDKEEFMAPTLLDVAATLDAEILCCDDQLDKFVGDVLIGAMRPSSALKWLRTSRNPLVITGGDRTELLLTLLESGVTGIILTGNLYPAIKVVERAREKNIPLLLVNTDTYTTVDRLGRIHGRITGHSLKRKKDIIIDMLREHVDLDRFKKDIFG